MQGRLSPPRVWKQSPPFQNIMVYLTLLLKNSNFFSILPITIRHIKLFGLDAFYEIMTGMDLTILLRGGGLGSSPRIFFISKCSEVHFSAFLK